MAGHSVWKNIKHRKAKQDARRSKVWSKCSRAIIVAARTGGGDPDMNISLRFAVDEAKGCNMPRETIEKAIAKGVGGADAESYDHILYEGYAPGGVAVLVEILTNNRNRTAGDVRLIFDKAGGNLGASGSVAYLFSNRGVVTIPKAAAGEDRLMEVVLEAGAQDVLDDGEAWQVVTEVSAFRAVRDALAGAKIEAASAELTMVPSTTVTITGEAARKVMALIEALEDNDDVQKVHANFDIPTEEMAGLG